MDKRWLRSFAFNCALLGVVWLSSFWLVGTFWGATLITFLVWVVASGGSIFLA